MRHGKSLSQSITQPAPGTGQDYCFLVENYDPQYLICFGGTEEVCSTTNCFAGASEKRSARYYLLMITGARACIEHRVQEFLNNSFAELPVCILVHDMDAVKLQQNTQVKQRLTQK